MILLYLAVRPSVSTSTTKEWRRAGVQQHNPPSRCRGRGVVAAGGLSSVRFDGKELASPSTLISSQCV